MGFEGRNGKKRLEIYKIPIVPVSEQVPLWVSEVRFEEQVGIVLEETWEQFLNQ